MATDARERPWTSNDSTLAAAASTTSGDTRYLVRSQASTLTQSTAVLLPHPGCIWMRALSSKTVERLCCSAWMHMTPVCDLVAPKNPSKIRLCGRRMWLSLGTPFSKPWQSKCTFYHVASSSSQQQRTWLGRVCSIFPSSLHTLGTTEHHMLWAPIFLTACCNRA